MLITASAATNTDIAEPEQQNVLKPKTSTQENVLDYIPKWVDASPTVLPEQSNQPIVPPTSSETEDKTWVDRKQRDIRQWADQTSRQN